MQHPPDAMAGPGGASAREFGRHSRLAARIVGVLAAAVLLGLLLYHAAIAFYLNLTEPEAASLRIDFAALWAAARLALEGAAISAFDPGALAAAQTAAHAGADDTGLVWHYPPTFHALVAPFGLLGFSLAFALFNGLGIAGLALALHPWSRGTAVAGTLVLLAPAALFTLYVGNTSLLWTAGLVTALTCLGRGRSAPAGLLLALLTMKPQLGLMVPVALAGGRHWGAMLWAVLGTVALVALTLPAFGLAHWLAFAEMTAWMSAYMAGTSPTPPAPETIRALTGNMVTWYALVRTLHFGHATGLAIQAVALVAAAAAVLVIWSRGRSAELRIAALCLASLLATPYAFQYELVLAVAAAFFLARAGLGTTPWGRAGLTVLWALPLPGWLIGGLEVGHYAAPVLTASLAWCTVLTFQCAGATPPGRDW